ncbi:AMP-binding protein [Thalassobius sp. Cn5-15]|uniref:AMP-binding protein n=1 Tax=Thalassobius sp. Cn5-15 TaxID=2917763 RepID=UPI001EF2AA7F|nr:AMP-binding protein [Thalassobius sp. Cn5-15]MCG7494742.1 AMP-binding protein [Thalassobius sp. Cn5-15]
MLPRVDSYGALYRDFRWQVPERLNMAVQVCDDWAARAPDRVAIRDVSSGAAEVVTYGCLRQMADSLAHQLVAHGVSRGDRVGVLRTQSAWTAAAHIACWKIGAISIPLFKLFGVEALLTRLEDAGVGVVIADPDATEGLVEWLKGANRQALVAEEITLTDQPFEAADTDAEDPAVLIYTSGTTGSPKGALHAHRMLIGHLPGVEMSHDFLGSEGDCIWTPADWAWIGGLFDVLMPGLALGVPVVATRMGKFTADECQRIIAAGSVRNVFFPPTALRMLKAEGAVIAGLRTVASGGEPLGAEMLDWGQEAFGVAINEFYGQTECNMVATSSGALFEARPACIGKPAPGFQIAILDDQGQVTQGEGEVAIKRGAASMMLGYWKRPQETEAKFIGDWMLTGDRGMWDGDFLRFVGREDDVITSAGYRIGPSEIEDGLLKHPAVATVGVVGKPDPLRTEIVKAYVVLKPDFAASDALAQDLQAFAKTRIAAHAYPREIAFLSELPMTVTGKVIRKKLKQRASEEGK